MRKVEKGSIIIGDMLVNPVQIEFYKMLADGESVANAAEALFIPYRTAEDRMYRLINHLQLKNSTHLIAYLLRNKIIQ